MATFIYPSAEWLEEVRNLYSAEFEGKLKSLSGHFAYQLNAEPSWGLEKSIFMAMKLEAGKLVKMDHCSEEDAQKSDFILSADVKVWKSILTGQDKFVGAFMGERIKMTKGETVSAMALAPHANTIVTAMTHMDLKYPDELSPDEFAEFKSKFAAYRAKRGV